MLDSPEKLKRDLSKLEKQYGVTAVESTSNSYKIKLKDRQQRFQSANLIYGEEGNFEEVTVVPNIGENFSEIVK